MIGNFEQLEPNDLVYLSSESLMIRVNPIRPASVSGQIVGSALHHYLAHITCQRALKRCRLENADSR